MKILKYHVIRSNYAAYIFVMPTNWFLILRKLKITDGMKKVKSVGAINVIWSRYQIFFLRKNTVNDNDNSDDIDDEVEDFTDFKHCQYLGEKI